ncbi:MAG: peptidoglycan editing factor PgeF [Steroidobacteraceae bacterium]
MTDRPPPRWPVLRPDWPAPPGIRAVMTLRQGGVSRPPFDALNVGARCGDAPEAVAENRRRIREALRLPSEPCWLTQVHGTEVVSLVRGAEVVSLGDGAEEGRTVEPPCADGAVTRTPGRVCAIQVADCLPVLFTARDGAAVGGSHAGWRGLAAGVLPATVRALAVEPSELLAWMGPAIGPQHFEVGDEVRTALLAVDGGAARAFTPNSRGRWQCDLYEIARRQLEALGVREVYGGGWCTYADPGRFFSYRRDGRCGRMAALVWIDEDRH